MLLLDPETFVQLKHLQKPLATPAEQLQRMLSVSGHEQMQDAATKFLLPCYLLQKRGYTMQALRIQSCTSVSVPFFFFFFSKGPGLYHLKGLAKLLFPLQLYSLCSQHVKNRFEPPYFMWAGSSVSKSETIV